MKERERENELRESLSCSLGMQLFKCIEGKYAPLDIRSRTFHHLYYKNTFSLLFFFLVKKQFGAIGHQIVQ